MHVAQRIEEGTPDGDFDLDHIKAIHKHLFQDVYDWVANIHQRLTQRRFLAALSLSDFAREAAQIIGDLNYVHPFREGNGRTQLQYLKRLTGRAGHDIDLTRLKRDLWQQASRAAHNTNYGPMAQAIAAALRR